MMVVPTRVPRFWMSARAPTVACAALLLGTCLASCRQEEAPPAVVRPVRTVVAARRVVDQPLSLTGQIVAREEASLAFRMSGRIIERLVDVGAVVQPGMVLARLDPRPEEDSLHSAEASLAAAKAQLTQAQNTFDRQNTLLGQGFTTRAQFDQAQQQRLAAQSQVDAAQADLRTAQDRLGYADLRTETAGVVTEKGAESGEVVQAGQMIVKVARQGGLDAVFDVPSALIRTAPRDIPVQVALIDDPRTKASGQVREVSPQADPVTRTYRVKVGLIDPPASMRFGATVVGSIRLSAGPTLTLPASALTQSGGQPAVWIVDPRSKQVMLRPVAVARYEQNTVDLSTGVEPGDLVVTAGVLALSPGQTVRLLGDPS